MAKINEVLCGHVAARVVIAVDGKSIVIDVANHGNIWDFPLVTMREDITVYRWHNEEDAIHPGVDGNFG